MYCVAAAAVGQSSFAVVLGLQLRRIIIHRTQQGVRLPMASGISGAWKEALDPCSSIRMAIGMYWACQGFIVSLLSLAPLLRITCCITGTICEWFPGAKLLHFSIQHAILDG